MIPFTFVGHFFLLLLLLLLLTEDLSAVVYIHQIVLNLSSCWLQLQHTQQTAAQLSWCFVQTMPKQTVAAWFHISVPLSAFIFAKMTHLLPGFPSIPCVTQHCGPFIVSLSPLEPQTRHGADYREIWRHVMEAGNLTCYQTLFQSSVNWTVNT